MQLVAYGAQDIYLTGNPQITFFKVVYRRHTNFAIETVEQALSGDSTSGSTNKDCSTIISRNGDLITNLYVTSNTPGIVKGDNILNEVIIEIGGQRIDKYYKEWFQVWSELTIPESKSLGFKNMIGAFSHNLNKTYNTDTIGFDANNNINVGANLVQIPVIFWFCRNPGLALPLIALQYHEIKLKFELGLSSDIGVDAKIKLFVDYIYLDTDERRRFAQVSHEYLIEQVQRFESSNQQTHNLNLNHPVKEIIWTSPINNSYGTAKIQLNGHDRFTEQEEEYFQLRQPMDYHTSIPGTNIFLTEKNQLNTKLYTINNVLKNINTFNQQTAGITNVNESNILNIKSINNTNILNIGTNELRVGDVLLLSTLTSTSISTGTSSTIDLNIVEYIVITGRIAEFSYLINFNNTNNIHQYGVINTGCSIRLISRMQDPMSRCSTLNKKINVYSFALQPEEHQPTGTCNFSRIDNAKLVFENNPGGNINIYSTNYNVLRIMNGMGGLAYSN